MVWVTSQALFPPALASSVSVAAPPEDELDAGEVGVPLPDPMALGAAFAAPRDLAGTRLVAMLVAGVVEEKVPCASDARAETLHENPDSILNCFEDDHAMAPDWWQAEHPCWNGCFGQWAP